MRIFSDREAAGKILGEKLAAFKTCLTNPIVLGIPRGGVAIGYSISEVLKAPFDAIVLRKLPIPDSPEVGFGAVTVDKTTIFNEEMLAHLSLKQAEISRIVNEVYEEVLRRNRIYRGNRPFPSLAGRSVILADDGLATGFTILAAIRFVKKSKPKEIITAVPVAHREAYNLVEKEADRVVILHISDLPYFAVAAFYEEFPEMSDSEVKKLVN